MWITRHTNKKEENTLNTGLDAVTDCENNALFYRLDDVGRALLAVQLCQTYDQHSVCGSISTWSKYSFHSL